MRAKLGVNIDHVATVRQARGTTYPDPVAAASAAEMAGADQITVHIRMDRRHIQERDLEILARTVQTRLNVEMAPTGEMLAIAEAIQPGTVTLVPEREGEVTTEGGLDLTVGAVRAEVAAAIERLRAVDIHPAVFIDPDIAQVEAAHALGTATVELNTAAYADAEDDKVQAAELARIASAAEAANEAGLYVAAGHGLHYHNIEDLAELDLISEFNIGHAIIARAIFSGLGDAVAEMKVLL
jgi:pyridoxine 5-phosphate synthase